MRRKPTSSSTVANDVRAERSIKMSVQFGRWNVRGGSVDRDYLESVKTALAPYGPDGSGSHVDDSVAILCYLLHTTAESRRETQPLVTRSGSILTWTGRLDNRGDLIHRFSDSLTANSTDLDIVAAAYESEKTGSFGLESPYVFVDFSQRLYRPRPPLLRLRRFTRNMEHCPRSVDFVRKKVFPALRGVRRRMVFPFSCRACDTLRRDFVCASLVVCPFATRQTGDSQILGLRSFQTNPISKR